MKNAAGGRDKQVEEKCLRTIQEMQGKFLIFRQDEIIQTSGRKTTRDMVLHPGAVAIAALTADRELILVRQYRYPTGQVTYEIPAGKLEKGEEPLASAQRELAEETGFTAGKWEKLTAFFTAPGFTNEMIHLYAAQELTAADASPDPDEVIEHVLLPLAEAYAKTQSGEIKDAKTIIAILWLNGNVCRTL